MPSFKRKKTKVALACSQCHQRNYQVNKSQSTQERLQLKKFCPHCGTQTLHVETC